MKRKKFLSILILIFTCLMSMTLFTACKEEHTHSYTQEVTKEATCIKGIMTYTCACGDTYTEEIPAIDNPIHSYAQEVTKEPTCENGIMTYTCVCGDTYTEEIPAVNEHLWVYNSQASPSSIDEFCLFIACKDCNAYRKHVCDKTTYAPACGVGGYDEIACKFCNYTKKDNFVDPLPHSFDTTYIINQGFHSLPCTTEGCDYKTLDIHTFSTDGVCTVCQYVLLVSENVVYEVVEGEDYAKILQAPEETRHILISETYNGVPVKVVGEEAFEDLWRLHTVILPDSITTIESRAFRHCINLSTLVIGSGLKYINDTPFSDCRSLHTIIFMGTMEQWNAVIKDEYWKMGGSYLKEIVCIDGTIPVEGTLYRE